ncbi:hypothetical protein B0H14DRAFT_2575188 [Mycena olivaceomarginata]|nr:hypothetical protein B0H14DRAFT_2575188 [Mycena olivaceomarginata]
MAIRSSSRFRKLFSDRTRGYVLKRRSAEEAARAGSATHAPEGARGLRSAEGAAGAGSATHPLEGARRLGSAEGAAGAGSATHSLEGARGLGSAEGTAGAGSATHSLGGARGLGSAEGYKSVVLRTSLIEIPQHPLTTTSTTLSYPFLLRNYAFPQWLHRGIVHNGYIYCPASPGYFSLSLKNISLSTTSYKLIILVKIECQ